MTKFKFIHNLSIKNKIILIVLLITLLIHSIGFTYITVWNMKRVVSAIESGLIIDNILIGNNCITPLNTGDTQQATIALSDIEKIGIIEMACLFDNQGKVFATYPAKLNPKDCPAFTEHSIVTFENDFFYVNRPIVFQNEKYGTLYIKANSTPLLKTKNKIIRTLILLSLVLSLLAIILANMMQRYISKPIVALKNHFERLTQTQDFSQQIKKRNNDEVGHLYDEFNNLINHIQTRSIERDKIEKQFKESQEKLALALQGGNIGIWEWDLKSDVREWDTKTEKMFGVDEGTFKQSYEAFKKCLHPDDIAPTEKALQNAINDIAPYDIIYRVVWKNKSIKFIRTKALVSKDKDGNPIRMLGVCFDVTELKETENKLKKHRENLEERIKERTKKLEEKNEELENFNQLFIDREFRIKELKDQIKRFEDLK